MGGANSVDLPGTHLNSVANTHNDPIVRSNDSSLNGKLVVKDANTNARNVCSAPSKIGEDHGHATMVANSISASLDSESEHGDQFQRKTKRYITLRTPFNCRKLSRRCLFSDSYRWAGKGGKRKGKRRKEKEVMEWKRGNRPQQQREIRGPVPLSPDRLRPSAHSLDKLRWKKSLLFQ